MLQLKHTVDSPEVLTPGTLDAISELRAADRLSDEDAVYFSESYRFLRSVESGLRLMNTTGASRSYPNDEFELERLAYLLGRPDGETVVRKCREYTQENRRRFEKLFSDQTKE